MNIEKRIKALQPYVIQIRFSNGVGIVDVVFKDGWKVPVSKVIDAVKGDDKNVNYYMFYTEKDGLGIDDVLDYIEQVININIEREKKYELLKVKTEELKDIFRKNPLSKLQDMKFILGDDELISNNIPEDFDSIPIINTNTTINSEDKLIDKVEEKKLSTNGETHKTKTKKVGDQEIELPPKNKKIHLENYSEPNTVCKCNKDDVCPTCINKKMDY